MFSSTLIILAIAIWLQIKHLNEMDVGFNRDRLLILDSTFSRGNPESFDYDALVNDLQQHPSVLRVGKSSHRPPNTGRGFNLLWGLPQLQIEEYLTVNHYEVDEHFLETFELELIAGRNFSADFPSDFQSDLEPEDRNDTERIYGVIITEATVDRFGFDSAEAALNEILMWSQRSYRVIGVIRNFRLSGGLEDVLLSTGLLRSTTDPLRVISLRIASDGVESALEHIDTVWERHRPGVAINRTFFDQTFRDMVYERTNGLSIASQVAAFVTLSIAALGLFALACFATQRRIKEIGIRKVVGATSASIVGLLTWDFVKPVLLACALSWLGSYYVTSYFFAQFSSRPEISVFVYFGVMLGMLLTAVLTVSTQCFRSANANPVESLRYE